MLPIHTILHPTDFSDRSAHALHLAAALARDYHARLVILHVIVRPVLMYGEGVIPPDPEELLSEAREHLDQLVIHDEAIPVERRIEEGEAAAVILQEATELGADLIVMGSHGRTGLGRVLMGSTAEQVSRRATCPVLTLTHPFPALQEQEALVDPAMALGTI